MNPRTENLIRSIQLLDRPSFNGWVKVLKGTPALDESLPTGITALAVACKLYSLAVRTEPEQAEQFAYMAAALLRAGADPQVCIGRKKGLRFIPWSNNPSQRELVVVEPGMSLAEACEGRLPPAVRRRLLQRSRAGHYNRSTQEGGRGVAIPQGRPHQPQAG